MKRFLLISAMSVASFFYSPVDVHAAQKEAIPLGVKGFYFGEETNGGILIQGSWSDSKKSYNPATPNTSEIFCVRDSSECTVYTAKTDGINLYLNSGFFTILKWDSNEIIGEDNFPLCVKQRLIINKKLKSVELVGIPKAPGDSLYDQAACKQVEKYGKFEVTTSVLVDGFKEMEKELHENCKKYFDKCE